MAGLMSVHKILPELGALPQCAAKRLYPYCNDTPLTNMRCKRRAKVMYEGVPLCTRHAGVAALNERLGATG